MLNLRRFCASKPGHRAHKLGQGARSRELTAAWKVRALIVAAVMAALFTTTVAPLLMVALTGPPPERSARDSARQFSARLTQNQIRQSLKASAAAYKFYLQQDLVLSDIEAIERECQSALSEGELIQALQLLGLASGDDYFALLTHAQYEDALARQAGGTVGIDVEIRYDKKASLWKAEKVGTREEQEGLKKGDEVVQINQIPLPPHGEEHEQVQKSLDAAFKRGGLHSTVRFDIRRNGQPSVVWLQFGVLTRTAAFSVKDYHNPEQDKDQSDVQELTFNHLRSKTVVADLYQRLRVMQTNAVRAAIVDLRKLEEGDGDTALQVAAMFMQRGTIGHRIETTGDGQLLMRDFEIVDGVVHRKTWGPFPVKPLDGAASGTPGGATSLDAIKRHKRKADKDEVTDWACNVFTGQVLAMVSRQTSGPGEVIATAFKHSHEEGQEKRIRVYSKAFTWGNGTGKTYYPVGSYWLRISTSFYLQPTGEAIEGNLGPRPNQIIPGSVKDELDFVRDEMVGCLREVPVAQWPGR